MGGGKGSTAAGKACALQVDCVLPMCGRMSQSILRSRCNRSKGTRNATSVCRYRGSRAHRRPPPRCRGVSSRPAWRATAPPGGPAILHSCAHDCRALTSSAASGSFRSLRRACEKPPNGARHWCCSAASRASGKTRLVREFEQRHAERRHCPAGRGSRAGRRRASLRAAPGGAQAVGARLPSGARPAGPRQPIAARGARAGPRRSEPPPPPTRTSPLASFACSRRCSSCWTCSANFSPSC